MNSYLFKCTCMGITYTLECGKQRLPSSAFLCYSPPDILSIRSYFNSGLTDLNSLVHKHTPQIHCLYLSRAKIVGSMVHHPSICVAGDLIFGIYTYVAHNGSNLFEPGAVTFISSFLCRKLMQKDSEQTVHINSIAKFQIKTDGLKLSWWLFL